jgi:hypothetical protein
MKFISLAFVFFAFSKVVMAQGVGFNEALYSTPVFSAKFPVSDEAVKYEHTKSDTSDENSYSVHISAPGTVVGTFRGDSLGVFNLTYIDLSEEPKPGTKDNFDAAIDSMLNDAVKTDSTLGGLYAREGSGKDSDTGDFVYVRIATRGNRLWDAQVRCVSCTQVDADKFFDSVLIK